MSTVSETTIPVAPSLATTGTERLALLWVFPHQQPTVTPIPQRLLIGRGQDCDVVMHSAQVSRRHLELRHNGPLLVGEDLKSRNGTIRQWTALQEGPPHTRFSPPCRRCPGTRFSQTWSQEDSFFRDSAGCLGRPDLALCSSRTSAFRALATAHREPG